MIDKASIEKYRRFIDDEFDGKLRVTLRIAAHKLNISARTARRYLDANRLEWAGNQVSTISIAKVYFSVAPKDSESEEDIELAERMAIHAVARRRVISSGIRV